MGFFYTGRGDKGISSLGTGKKIDKAAPEIVAIGDLDETTSLIGLVRSKTKNIGVKKILRTIQEDLFTIQANVAKEMFGGDYTVPKLTKEKVEWLESEIDALEKKVAPRRGFVIPGESIEEAWLDYARAVSRRAERSVLFMHKTKPLDATILAYLNRLSSLLFALARASIKTSGIKEDNPEYS